MDWLWILQLAINLTFALMLVVYWKDRSVKTAESQQAIDNGDAAAQHYEREFLALKKKTEDQLRFLISLCEQASSILMKHKNNGIAAKATLEEEELRALRSSPMSGVAFEAIPSVQDLEARKQSIRPEIPVDLRSLLRDQLS